MTYIILIHHAYIYYIRKHSNSLLCRRFVGEYHHNYTLLKQAFKKSKMFQRPTFPCKLIVIRAFIFLYAQVKAQNAKAVTLQLKAES